MKVYKLHEFCSKQLESDVFEDYGASEITKTDPAEDEKV